MIAFSTELRAEVILSALGDRKLPGRRAVDIGSGTGVAARILRGRLGLDLVAADVKDQLEVDLPFVRFDAGKRLPFVDAEFDIAFLNDVLHHVPSAEQRSLIVEALRVAKAVFIFEVEPGFMARAIDRFFNHLHYRDMPLPMSFRTASDWGALLRRSGVHVEVKTVPRPFRLYPLNHVAIYCEHGD